MKLSPSIPSQFIVAFVVAGISSFIYSSTVVEGLGDRRPHFRPISTPGGFPSLLVRETSHLTQGQKDTSPVQFVLKVPFRPE